MYHIIINPASRSGNGQKLWKTIIEPYLMEQRMEYISYFSKGAGDVARLAGEITRDATPAHPKRLVILGGDGTVNETLQGIKDFRSVILSYIPTGSSNDFARDLQLPKNPLEAVKVAFSTGTPHKMDVGCVTFKDKIQHYFAVSCGIGFDAAVCEETNRSAFKKALNKIGLGKLAYLTIAVKQLMTAERCSCRFSLDDKNTFTLNKYLFSASMLHRYEGGGFQFCPDAKADDGILNICTATTKLPRFLILLVLPSAFFGRHYLFPGITPYKARRIQIKASTPLWIHTDGEILRKDDYAEITCLRRVLTVVH